MTFDILQHLDQLKPDGGTNNPRGDHSFHCPKCDAPNFKVNVVTGKWACFGCDCSSTEEGKRAIRNALSPAQHRYPDNDVRHNLKPIRPKAKRSWEYRSEDRKVILRVHRTDDGKGNRKFWQTSLIRAATPKDLRGLVVPYRLEEALSALDEGAPFVAWVEGEGCADRMWELGLPAVTSLGGSGGFDPKRDGGHFDPAKLVVFPDQDQGGVKYAVQVAAAYPGCRWVLPYPGTAQWNGAMPKDGGRDVADWIADGATVEEILNGIVDRCPIEIQGVPEHLAPSQGAPGHLARGSDAEDREPTYLELVDATLAAIKAGNINAEMDSRRELKQQFRLSDEKISAALFKRLTDAEVEVVKPSHRSVDLGRVEQLTYLKDGWLPKGDVAHWYAPYGSGKTTTALALAWSVALGKSFLDRSDAGEPGKVLFIATDSGLGPLKKACDDLGIDPDNPVLKPGHRAQRIHVWGHDPGQGQASWCADINGVIKLRSFIEEEGITAVFIDSVKSITSAAGWSHEHNLPSRELLRYLREIVCQPLGCSIVLLNHDGTKEGSHSGAKSWSEDPSIVVSFAKALAPDGRQIGISATFKKDRAAVVDPFRTLTFTLDREAGKLVLAGDVEIVGSCREAVIDVLWRAYQRGVKSISRKVLLDEVWERYRKPTKTVDNTLGVMVGNRQLVKPCRGHYGLAPALIQRLEADCLVGSNSERSQSEREISEVPDAVPMGKTGKNEVPKGKPPGSQQTRCSTGRQQQLLPMRHQPWGSGEDDPHWGPRPA